MRIINGIMAAALLIGLLNGCRSAPARPTDIRAALLQSARKNDPTFPNGREVLLAHFSHVGELTTLHGDVIYVADMRAVLAGMLAPRGQNRIFFFDQQFRFLGKISYIASRPLWCDGAKLHLFGDLDGFPQPGQPFLARGNVIDVEDGYDNLRCYSSYAYDSSGGIDD